MCLDVGNVPLLKNIRSSLIDPDTPDSAKTIKAANGKEWQLVVSTAITIVRYWCSRPS